MSEEGKGMGGGDHQQRAECAGRLAALEVRMATIAEQTKVLPEMDRRLTEAEGWIKLQNGTLGFIREQVGTILTALTKFQTHSEDFEREIVAYRREREEKEREAAEVRAQELSEQVEELKKGIRAGEDADVETAGKIGLLRAALKERGTWLVMGMMVILVLILVLSLGLEWWQATASRVRDQRLPVPVTTPTPAR